MKRHLNKLIIGLTGSFGSGKTTVAGMFKKYYGAKVVDADKLSHGLIKKGSSIFRKITRVFGKGILKKDKSIDRKRLSQAVFNDRRKLQRLNMIVHPVVIAAVKKELKHLRGGLIVLDIPLLFEAGLEEMVEKIVVVKINRKEQLRRLLKKYNLSKTAILSRIKAQMPLSDKVRRADFVIDNSYTFEKTKKQVKEIWRLLWKN